jgi:hypothetical protein
MKQTTHRMDGQMDGYIGKPGDKPTSIGQRLRERFDLQKE